MNLDSVKNAIAVIVRALTAKYDYHALYPAKVIAQNGDGTLELKPEDETMPGVSRVPIRVGIPGVSVTVKPSARVLMGFEAGDPQRPIATLWDTAAVEKIEMNAAVVDMRAGKGRSIACNGDMVMVPSTKPIPVFLFTDPPGLVPALTPTPGAPLPPMFARFGLPPSFTMVGQIVAVSPNKS